MTWFPRGRGRSSSGISRHAYSRTESAGTIVEAVTQQCRAVFRDIFLFKDQAGRKKLKSIANDATYRPSVSTLFTCVRGRATHSQGGRGCEADTDYGVLHRSGISDSFRQSKFRDASGWTRNAPGSVPGFARQNRGEFHPDGSTANGCGRRQSGSRRGRKHGRAVSYVAEHSTPISVSE